MKKTLIALAALASFGSAFADGPSITPYARIDIAVSNTNTSGANDPGMKVVSGGYNSSLFGLKGEQDIGSGTKIFGKVEQWMDPTSGNGFAQGGAGAARTGAIGLSGSFGTLQLGTDFGPYDYAINGALDAQHLAPEGTRGAWGSGAHYDNGNDPKGSGTVVGMIEYTTPVFSGFNAMIAYAPSKDATNSTDTSYTSAALFYNAGPVSVALGMEHVPTSLFFPTAAVSSYTDAYALTGSYNFGPATLFLGADNAKVNGTAAGSDTDNGYEIGVKVPMDKWEFSLGYATQKTSGDDKKQTANSYGLQALYSLNKTAKAYVGVLSNQINPEVGSSTTATTVSAGLTMSF